MWFPERIRHLGQIDIQPALNALNELPEEAWFANEALKKKLAGDRPTQSLFFYSMSQDEYAAKLAEGPIAQSDVRHLDAHATLYQPFKYLFDAIEKHYGSGGAFLRAQVARMPPGGTIKEHRDNMIILENTHRVHVPIVTTPKLKFFVDKERVVLEAGNIYELNNQLYHWVENPMDSINRIHLILDYLPPEYNVPASTGENFKFYIRQHRAARPVKPAASDLPLPTVAGIVAVPDDARWHFSVHVADMQRGESRPVIDWSEIEPAANQGEQENAPQGIAVVNKQLFVASGSSLHWFDERFKHKKSFASPFLVNARALVHQGKHLYVVSRGANAILRFDIKKRVFDTAWQLYSDASGKIAIREYNLSREPSFNVAENLGLSAVAVTASGFLIAADNFVNVIKVENGKVDSGDQLPRGTTELHEFNKGVAYLNPAMGQVAYMSDYDFRAHNRPTAANDARDGEANGDQQFSAGLAKYYKGTLLAGCQPAALSLLDMKNQSVVAHQALRTEPSSRVLAVAIFKES